MRTLFNRWLVFAPLAIAFAASATPAALRIPAAAARPGPQTAGKDYLSSTEADKIRDAGTPADRIKLYTAFAQDRLEKFQYELARKVPEERRADILNGLLRGYSGCLDDANDQIDVAKEQQADIHKALKLLVSKTQDFLATLQKIRQAGAELDTYKYSLEDAIDDTKDTISAAQGAQKEMLPAPVRRKQ